MSKLYLNKSVTFEVTIKIILLAIIFCLIYACSDEFHQFFVAGRAGRLTDILIDTTGSILGVLTYYLVYNKYNKIKVEKTLIIAQ